MNREFDFNALFRNQNIWVKNDEDSTDKDKAACNVQSYLDQHFHYQINK